MVGHLQLWTLQVNRVVDTFGAEIHNIQHMTSRQHSMSYWSRPTRSLLSIMPSISIYKRHERLQGIHIVLTSGLDRVPWLHFIPEHRNTSFSLFRPWEDLESKTSKISRLLAKPPRGGCASVRLGQACEIQALQVTCNFGLCSQPTHSISSGSGERGSGETVPSPCSQTSPPTT